MKDEGQRLETLCIHAGQHPDPIHGAVMTPIVLASTFAQKSPGQYDAYDYSRAGNPTRTALEGCLAALEGAKHGVAFGSGCAATTAILLGAARPATTCSAATTSTAARSASSTR